MAKLENAEDDGFTGLVSILMQSSKDSPLSNPYFVMHPGLIFGRLLPVVNLIEFPFFILVSSPTESKSCRSIQ